MTVEEKLELLRFMTMDILTRLDRIESDQILINNTIKSIVKHIYDIELALDISDQEESSSS